MRILIVSTNRTKQPTPVVPYGACLVASLLQHHGHDVHFLDMGFERKPHKALERKLNEIRPEIVGLSVRNIDNLDRVRTQQYTALVAELMPIIRRCMPSAKIIIGGAAVGFNPQKFLDLTGADALYMGDAETKLLETIEQLHRGELKDRVVDAIGTYQFDRQYRARVWKWVDLDAYQKTELGVPVQMKRGCGRACAHCNSYLVVEGRGIRARHIDEVLDEVEEILAVRKSPYIEILDSVLNRPVDFLESFCRRAIERGVKARFQSSNFWPQGVTEDLIELMARAGFYSLYVAAESASDKILQELNRGYRSTDLEQTARVLGRSPIHVFWMFMAGSPSESVETIQESFRFVDRFVRSKDMVYWNCGVRAFPATLLAKRFLPDADLFEPTFFEPLGINYQQMVDLLEGFCVSRANSVVSSENEFARYISWVLNRLHVRPPYWQYARIAHRYWLNPLLRAARRVHADKYLRRIRA